MDDTGQQQQLKTCPRCAAHWSKQHYSSDCTVCVREQGLTDPFAESREGMVSVHDHTGKCIGSMGVEAWAQIPREGDPDWKHIAAERETSLIAAHQRIAELRGEIDAERSAGMNDWRTRCLAAEATLDANDDPAVYVSWQRAANRAETEADALQVELKALLIRVLEARLEHTCADHSHETRWGCPECRLVDHMDRRGWESLEAVRDA